MLERMKHLFEIGQVVFVVATDTAQLSHSVGAMFPSSTASATYPAFSAALTISTRSQDATLSQVFREDADQCGQDIAS